MAEYTLSEARAILPQLLTRASEGEVITITRRGAPAVVVVGHDRWVKTRTHDVLIQAQQLRARLNEARTHRHEPLVLPESSPERTAAAEAHIAWLREEDPDPWDDTGD